MDVGCCSTCLVQLEVTQAQQCVLPFAFTASLVLQPGPFGMQFKWTHTARSLITHIGVVPPLCASWRGIRHGVRSQCVWLWAGELGCEEHMDRAVWGIGSIKAVGCG